jgi:hypothetical protein
MLLSWARRAGYEHMNTHSAIPASPHATCPYARSVRGSIWVPGGISEIRAEALEEIPASVLRGLHVLLMYFRRSI